MNIFICDFNKASQYFWKLELFLYLFQKSALISATDGAAWIFLPPFAALWFDPTSVDWVLCRTIPTSQYRLNLDSNTNVARPIELNKGKIICRGDFHNFYLIKKFELTPFSLRIQSHSLFKLILTPSVCCHLKDSSSFGKKDLSGLSLGVSCRHLCLSVGFQLCLVTSVWLFISGGCHLVCRF